jgi:hypothetical protein
VGTVAVCAVAVVRLTAMGQVLPMPGNGRRRDGRAPIAGQADAEVVDLAIDNVDDEPETEELALYFDDLDDDELIRQWEEAERECVAVLRGALPDLRAAKPPADAVRAAATEIRRAAGNGEYPHVHLVQAAGWAENLPDDDWELWLGTTGALTSMRLESGLDTDTEAVLVALELADWVGAVIGLVRAGVGAYAEPRDLVRYIDDCPEIAGETDPDDAMYIESVLETVTESWRATGALDDSDRLTPLGWWGLPRALGWAWRNDFDADS